MKEVYKSILYILIFGVVLAVLYFFVPSSVKNLNRRINQSDPTKQDAARLNLFKEYGDFMNRNLPEKIPALYFYWYSNQRKMSDLRVKQAIEKIKNTNSGNNEIKIWSLLNMGVVIKTKEKTIAIDTANLPFSQAHNELVDVVDIFLVTHADGDHFDSTLLKKALDKNKEVVFLEGIYGPEGKSKSISLISGEVKNVDDIKITAYQTDHRGDGNFNDTCAWFVIETEDFKLLHTGDGRDFKNKEESQKVYAMKDFDILLGNSNTGSTLHPYNIRDLKPKILIPLHLFKFMHGDDLYRESTIELVSEAYARYNKDLQGIEKVFLLPGESYTYFRK
ncbi:MAG TPA: MBL fold metallo-hydrolase [Patescibacteria group bacterium]|nr:MBL fold metallo-hydrolase [Patescibacteria group bacterium]